ncbi:MAG: glycosyl hydrolase [bacterium]|nr:glycosyl hydrolase [bacterium]
MKILEKIVFRLNRSLILLFVLFAALSAVSSKIASAFDEVSGVQAIKASEFLDSIGVNSSISRRGETLTDTIDAVTYLGMRWIRTGYEGRIPIADLIELHKRTGVRFSYGLLSGGADLDRLLSGARELAAAGALIALEGNNEPNNWGIEYLGEKGGGKRSWLPVAKLQRDLYDAVKNDHVLKEYPVWSLSENGAETDNAGLQFLTIPDDADCLMSGGTRFADFANCHNYMTHPSWPGLHDNQTWIAADPTAACKVDGLYGNYGRTWRIHAPGYAESDLLNLPRVTTETGITLDDEITERIQALLYMSVYLDQCKRGWKHTAIYLLRDRSDESGNQTFGFYRPDYSRRLAADYLHNLTRILADSGAADSPERLNYSIEGQTDMVHDLLIQKSNGRLYLTVWGERFTGGSDEVRVKLGKTFALVNVFDPTTGDTPMQRLTSVDSVRLTVSDHPFILELY